MCAGADYDDCGQANRIVRDCYGWLGIGLVIYDQCSFAIKQLGFLFFVDFSKGSTKLLIGWYY
jgi:hypothetical protein